MIKKVDKLVELKNTGTIKTYIQGHTPDEASSNPVNCYVLGEKKKIKSFTFYCNRPLGKSLDGNVTGVVWTFNLSGKTKTKASEYIEFLISPKGPYEDALKAFAMVYENGREELPTHLVWYDLSVGCAKLCMNFATAFRGLTCFNHHIPFCELVKNGYKPLEAFVMLGGLSASGTITMSNPSEPKDFSKFHLAKISSTDLPITVWTPKGNSMFSDTGKPVYTSKSVREGGSIQPNNFIWFTDKEESADSVKYTQEAFEKIVGEHTPENLKALKKMVCYYAG
jgi:hypothetical protein